MKKLYLVFLVALVCQFSFANGVVIVDNVAGTYLKMTQSQIDVIVQNQIATIVTSQKFINDFGSAQIIEYAFPVPVEASVTQLRYRINGGDWYLRFLPQVRHLEGVEEEEITILI